MSTLDSSGWPVVRLEGDIDAATILGVEVEVAAALIPWPQGVVLDLGEVTFFGSDGAGVITAMLRSGLRVHIVAMSRQARRPLEILGLLDAKGVTVSAP